VEVPSELDGMVRDDDLERLRVEVRPLYAPVPPALVTAAAAMTLGCALLSMVVLVGLTPSGPVGLAVTFAMAAVSALGMAQVLWAAARASAWLELQVAPHQLRVIAHDAVRRPRVRTVALGDLLGAEVVGDELVVRTRTGVHRLRFPDRGESTRAGVNQLLRAVVRRSHTFGSPEEVPSNLTRWLAMR
jgi:hypothetical protein